MGLSISEDFLNTEQPFKGDGFSSAVPLGGLGQGLKLSYTFWARVNLQMKNEFILCIENVHYQCH